MKILIITQYFWPESFRINDLSTSLQERGHEVTVLTGLPNYPSGKLFNNYGYRSIGKSKFGDVKLIRVPLIPRMKGKPWQLILNYISFVIFSCTLGVLYSRGKYDLIFVYEPSPFTVGIPGVFLRYLKKIPMIFWVQDLWPESIKAASTVRSKTILNLVSIMVRWIYQRCDLVLVQSEAFLRPAILSGADPEKTHYFPNYAEELYKPVQIDSRHKASKNIPDGFIIMFAGNLGEAQSLDTIINTANSLKHIIEIQWVIIGDGRRQEWMINEAKKYDLGSCMHFLGRLPIDDMPAYFSRADLLLVTLKDEMAFMHTIPSKIQSYMACAKPIVAAINGESARVIEESMGGRSVNAEDVDSLVKVIDELYHLEQIQRDEMGKAAYEYYQSHYERSMLLNRLEYFMEQLVN